MITFGVNCSAASRRVSFSAAMYTASTSVCAPTPEYCSNKRSLTSYRTRGRFEPAKQRREYTSRLRVAVGSGYVCCSIVLPAIGCSSFCGSRKELSLGTAWGQDDSTAAGKVSPGWNHAAYNRAGRLRRRLDRLCSANRNCWCC